MNPYSTSRLSDRDQAVIDVVDGFGQVTTSQLRRLYFSEPDNSPYSREQRTSRALNRLVEWKYIKRIKRQVGGDGGGSGEHVYIPRNSHREEARAHEIAVMELYVRLIEASRQGRCSEVEYVPAGPRLIGTAERFGNTEIRPDVRLRLKTSDGTYRWYIEVDRGRRDSAEYDRQLSAKMRGYISAWKQRTKPLFPLVLFTARDEARAKFIRRVIGRQEVPEMFQVVLFDDAVHHLAGGQSV